MSDEHNLVGKVSWMDLTVNDAEEIRQFYEAVANWTNKPVQMGDYQDYCMESGDGETVAGICHAKGENANLPAQWLIYINVEDLDTSIERCQSLGGKVVQGPREIPGAWLRSHHRQR